jgi:hypothetical protein
MIIDEASCCVDLCRRLYGAVRHAVNYAIPTTRSLLLPVLAPLFSIILFLATGELALRVIYRDGGRTTLGAPGGRRFEHLQVFGDRRGRLDEGPRRPGFSRIMILGDSVTWGQGVRDWWDLWPEQLANKLERQGQPTEMAVYALPGRNIPEHLKVLQDSVRTVKPDILIYQWHPNDIEVVSDRPATERRWQQLRFHEPLRQLSYLYFFLDNRLSMFLPAPTRSYLDYLVQDFAPGTYGWAEFERVFHSFATLAKQIVPRRLMMVYPQVPFEGVDPLKPLKDQMRHVAGPHALALSPATWVVRDGTRTKQADAPWGEVARIATGKAGIVLETREYYTGEGALDLTVEVSCEATSGSPLIGALEVVDVVTDQIVGHAPLTLAGGVAGWQRIPARIDVRGVGDHSVRFRVAASGAAGFAVASITMPVDYGFEVVDLTEPLNTFDTHASIFDAHPNKRAHAVMAQVVLEALRAATLSQ